MYTYGYDFSFSPSMPVVEVAMTTITHNTESLTVMAMIDSGSDGTLIPLSYLQAIKAQRSGQVFMRSITGVRTIVDIYEVALRIGPHRFPYVRVVGDKHNEIIVLGRDLLNQLVVTLNGLAAVTEIQE